MQMARTSPTSPHLIGQPGTLHQPLLLEGVLLPATTSNKRVLVALLPLPLALSPGCSIPAGEGRKETKESCRGPTVLRSGKRGDVAAAAPAASLLSPIGGCCCCACASGDAAVSNVSGASLAAVGAASMPTASSSCNKAVDRRLLGNNHPSCSRSLQHMAAQSAAAAPASRPPVPYAPTHPPTCWSCRSLAAAMSVLRKSSRIRCRHR